MSGDSAMIDAATLTAQLDGLDCGVQVLPEYIDPNGHLNIGYYGVVAEKALVRACSLLGIGWDLIEREGKNIFALESHITYQRELKLGDTLHFAYRILDFDAKRLHYFLRVEHATERWLAATLEVIGLCVDLKTRRSTDWPAAALETFTAVHALQRGRPIPAEVGRVIGIRRSQGSRAV
jgi:acyl-CoA thioester hydrolase